MPVPSLVTDLSATIASNSPAGSDNVFPDLDGYLRSLSGFLASIRDNSGNGWVSPYLTAASPVYTGTLTGGTGVVNLGSGQFYKSATGNVGIGTSSPGVKLQVDDDNPTRGIVGLIRNSAASVQTGTQLHLSQNGIADWVIGQPAATNAFAIWSSRNTGADGTERLRIDNVGNLGLGVTPSAWGASEKFIDIGSTVSVGRGGSAQALLLFNSFINSSGQYIYKLSSFASAYEQLAGQHKWFTAPSGTAGNAITFTQAMTLDASGNLAIGTASTSGRLYVVSPTQSIVKVKGGTATGQSSAFYVERAGSTATLAAFGDAASILGGTVDQAVAIYADSSIPITFNQSNTERARIDSSGNLLITGAGGLGYGTGSGGAVTQITSRTTGVTLNKTNGAITLVSAAGTATWQSFAVTNSTVAATDTVIVNQKSGTDKYLISVTGVNAGSFAITFATTGGTTTEQPVFNFAVIKAVTA